MTSIMDEIFELNLYEHEHMLQTNFNEKYN